MFDTFRHAPRPSARRSTGSAEPPRPSTSSRSCSGAKESRTRPGSGRCGRPVRSCRDPLAAALSSRVPGLTFDVTREAATESRVGVSEMEWGLADTGTVVQDATDPALRLVSTLPEIHVALLPASRILPGLADVLPKLDPGRAPYISFVTGPSRTADIERVLTIGVHGPVAARGRRPRRRRRDGAEVTP